MNLLSRTVSLGNIPASNATILTRSAFAALETLPPKQRSAVYEKLDESKLYFYGYKLTRAAAYMDAPVNNLPENPDLRAWRAEILWRLGKIREACADWDMALRQDPNHVQTLVWQADVARQKGNLSGARRLIEKALTRDASYSPALCVQLAIHLSEGQVEQAWETTSRALQCEPVAPTAFYIKALCLYRQGRSRDAIQALGQAREAAEYLALHTLLLRGAIWLELGEFRKARQDAGAAVKMYPNNIQARNLRYDSWRASAMALLSFKRLCACFTSAKARVEATR